MTVGRWLNEGKIPFFTTGGGNKRVWDIDLARFLKTHNYPIPKNLEPLFYPTVLLVDDDPIIRKILRRLIMNTHPKSRIYEAADGFEAGEQMATVKPSLVILDIYMPGLSGLEVCSRIRNNPSMKDVNILMVTADAINKMGELAFKAGADAFLVKPFQHEAFLKIFQQLLKKHLPPPDPPKISTEPDHEE